MKLFRPLLLAAFVAAVRLFATAPEDPTAQLAEMRKLADGLRPQSGKVMLHGGLAELNLPNEFRFLNADDTATVLSKIWRNPKSDSLLGMIVPAGFDPIDDETWAVVVSYEEDGYVNDDDAAKIDYAELMAKMKVGAREANEERQKEGFVPIEIVGWAATPRYDAAAHKLYWAKEIKFGDEATHTLNYNIRMLGRRGVLVLNVVAGMPQLADVEKATPALLAMVDFQPGHRYADFNADTDKTATYGIAALVAGGVAAKTGLLKALWLGILAFKKFIILGLIALAGSAKKIWDWIRGRAATEPSVATATPPSDQRPPTA
ncbi:MAG: DUF2167 domain-containing protein [Opitutae bacterium]|nr:DUF2167 domain-containing protein [Opitutae bacterium]